LSYAPARFVGKLCQANSAGVRRVSVNASENHSETLPN